jgi:hypothetical protein
MARNASSRSAKKIPDGYQLAYDADGNVVLVPSTPDTAPARSPFNRISEGIKEGYGAGPIQGPTPEEFAKYPIASTIAEPFSMGFNALKRIPGAIAGGLAGTAGAGTELWTGDRGAANEAENAARSAMEYFANKGMAEPGIRPSANIPRNGELLAPERGPAPQLGYRGAPVIENMLELPPGAIRGTSAEGAPRIAYLKPEQRYQMALDRAAGSRPLSNYERPAIDQTFVRPEDIRSWSEGNVARPVDPIAALNTETSVPVSNAPKWENARQQEAQRITDFISEGNVAPTQQRTLQRLANETEADFRARQMSALEGESGAITSGRNPPNRVARALQLTERQPAATSAAPAAPAPMQFGLDGPQPVSGSFVDPMTASAYQPRTFLPGRGTATGQMVNPMTGEALSSAPTLQTPLIEQLRSGQISGREYQAAIDAQRTAAAAPAAESPLARAMASAPEGVAVDPVQAAINAAKQRADAMARSHADAAAQQAVIDAAAQRAGTGSGPMFPNYKPYSPPSLTTPLIGAGAIGAGALALNSGSQQVQPPGQPQAPRPIDPEITTRDGSPIYFTGPMYDINDKRMSDYMAGGTPSETLGSRRATASAIDSAYAPVGASPAPATAPQQAIQTARSLQARQADARSLIEGKSAPMSRPSDGFLSNLFANRPASTKQLFEQSQTDPSDSGAWMRAERQYAKSHPDAPNFDVTQLNESGMKRGGAANSKPGKDEAVHKALDIIQHLLMRH